MTIDQILSKLCNHEIGKLEAKELIKRAVHSQGVLNVENSFCVQESSVQESGIKDAAGYLVLTLKCRGDKLPHQLKHEFNRSKVINIIPEIW